MPNAKLFIIEEHAFDNWYEQMLQFLMDGSLPFTMSTDQKKKFALQSCPFMIIVGYLCLRGANQIINRCVLEEKQRTVL